MKVTSPLSWIALILVVIGGLNWGLVGAFDFDLVAYLFGSAGLIAVPAIAKIVYILVGLAAIYTIFVALTNDE